MKKKTIIGIVIGLLVVISLGDVLALLDNKDTIILERIYDKEYDCYDIGWCDSKDYENKSMYSIWCGISRKCDFVRHTGLIGNIIELA